MVAEDYGLPTLREDSTIRIAVSRAGFYTTPNELQDIAFRDIAAAYGDPIDYICQKRGCSREEARRYLTRAREALEEFPPAGNPGSMVNGSKPAVGITEKAPGEFNPDIAASSPDNSVMSAMEKLASSGTPS